MGYKYAMHPKDIKKYQPRKYTVGGVPSNPGPFELYRCCWVEDGDKKKGYAKGINGANNEMLHRLEEGLASWIELVAESDLSNDDIPF